MRDRYRSRLVKETIRKDSTRMNSAMVRFLWARIVSSCMMRWGGQGTCQSPAPWKTTASIAQTFWISIREYRRLASHHQPTTFPSYFLLICSRGLDCIGRDGNRHRRSNTGQTSVHFATLPIQCGWRLNCTVGLGHRYCGLSVRIGVTGGTQRLG